MIELLFAVVDKDRESLDSDNIFKVIGFDGDKPRLGWVIPPSWSEVEMILKELEHVIRDKKEFIFIGMGGSVNGIKVLKEYFKKDNIHFLDSLDPSALERLLMAIEDKEQTQIIAISKSGTTLETQLLANTLKEVFPIENFLWLSDPVSFSKLDKQGWTQVNKFPIQFNRKDDIGGRFSCPHTLVFFLPLFIIYQNNLSKLKDIYQQYISIREQLLEDAYRKAYDYKEKSGYFFVQVRKDLIKGFDNWITQLFQESLGSKIEGFYVKTIVSPQEDKLTNFNHINFNYPIEDSVVYIMSYMYYLQCFVAFYAAFKKINFVSQDYVERYKKEIKNIKKEDIQQVAETTISELITEIGRQIKDKDFIEFVLYFNDKDFLKEQLIKELNLGFPDKRVFVFEGSDWNHHSYQAAVNDKNTIFIFLLNKEYKKSLAGINTETIDKNVFYLKAISLATYRTLKDKSIYKVLNFNTFYN